MIINTSAQLGDFYRKSEIEFLGTHIDYKYMTPEQLNKTIVDSINLYNKLYPPKEKSGFNKAMNTLVTVGLIIGTAGVAAGAILAAYGVGMGTAMGTVFGAGTATASAGSMMASIQTGASYVSAAGMVYGKVSGDKPDDLMKAADFVSSENALVAMEKVAKEELKNKGVELQEKDKASNDALRERLRQEQKLIAEKLEKQAALKAQALGQQPPEKKKTDIATVFALATPFILMALR